MQLRKYRYAFFLLTVLLITIYLFHVLFGVEKLASESIDIQIHNIYIVFTPWHLCVVLYISIILPTSLLLLAMNSYRLGINIIAVIAAAGFVFGCTVALDSLACLVYSQQFISLYNALPGTMSQQGQTPFLQNAVHAVYVLQALCISILIVSSISVGRHTRMENRRTY